MNFYKGNIEDLSHDSVSHKTFGESSQITVLGHFQEGYKKTYIVRCSICIEDPELYQKGLFMCSRTYVNGLKLPCGCSSVPKWNVDQQYIRVLRACSEMGCTIVTDFDKLNYENQYTKITVCCKLHGERTVPIASITSKRRCRKCVQEESSLSLRKPDNIMIQGFLESGAFHPETIFYRSERKTSQGCKNYWWVDCPVCGYSGEAISGDLKKGNQPCQCIKNQRQSYINLVSDGDLPVAIKFGIAKDFKSRIPRQNKRSVYTVTNLKAWEFPTKESCILAELECKQRLNCGILQREEMPDGFSETTYVYNLDKISEIFEKHGGVTIH
jgi:hypothetical protein